MAYITPSGEIIETAGGTSLFPTASAFEGPVGGEIEDLSLVPELSMPPVGGRRPSTSFQAGTVSPPWLFIGGLVILMLSLRTRR